MSPTKRTTHPLESGIAVVPAFIIKLWKLVEDPSCNHLICWSAAENSFIVKNHADFAKELLPHYFKHSNLASFIRQLNFYGFHKVASAEGRSLQNEENEIEFYHPFFIRQQKGLLCLIKRKVGKGDDAISASDVQDLLTDVKALQGKQDTVDTLLSEMKQENQILWQEVAQLREKHAKQQRIVAKLIHFLATLVRPKAGNLSIKRKTPLMIDLRKTLLSSVEQAQASTSKKLKKDICLSANMNNCSAIAKLNNIQDKDNHDLIIHDVTDDSSNDPCLPVSQTDYVIVESPLGDDTVTGNTISGSCNAVNLLEPLILLEPLQSKSALAEHLQYAGGELDWLHEQLSHERMNIDASDILSLFNEDDCVSENPIPLLDIFPSQKSPERTVGNEVVASLSPPLDFSMLDDPLEDDSLPDVLSVASCADQQ